MLPERREANESVPESISEQHARRPSKAILAAVKLCAPKGLLLGKKLFGPQMFSAWLLSVGSAAALAEVAMCQGGACTRNGGPLLLDSAAVLLSKHTDQVKVMNSACSSECPAKGSVATPNRGVTPSRTLPTGYANSALSSASEIVHEAGFVLDHL